MSDIEKIRIIHDVKKTFTDIDPDTLSKLSGQINNSNFRENIERFYKGFNSEDFFSNLFSVFPWVKLIHKLDENQFPEASKTKYQIPDFMLIFEDSKKNDHAILVDVKTVSGKKQTLSNIQKKQVTTEAQYSSTVGLPIVYAIYWEYFQVWTINSLESFEEKKNEYKITFIDAYKNDLSLILGDLGNIIGKFYRKTICDANIIDKKLSKHEKYGTIIEEYLSLDKLNWIISDPVESAIIDGSLQMKIIETNKKDNITIYIEENNSINLIKSTTLILRHLGVFGLGITAEYTNISIHVLSEFLRKLDIKQSYSLPNSKTPTIQGLMKKAFDNTWVYKNYINH